MLNLINHNYSSFVSQEKSTIIQNHSNLTQNLNSAQKVLGYETDANGYFTSDFNKAANIPSDIKIKASDMKNIYDNYINQDSLRRFSSMDIAKTAGNAYKIIAQISTPEQLKNGFASGDLSNLPYGFEFDKDSLEITKTYENKGKYLSADLARDYQNPGYNPLYLANTFLDLGLNQTNNYAKFDNSNLNTSSVLAALINNTAGMLISGTPTILGIQEGLGTKAQFDELRAFRSDGVWLEDFFKLMMMDDISEYKKAVAISQNKYKNSDNKSMEFINLDLFKEDMKIFKEMIKKLQEKQKLKNQNQNKLNLKI